MDALTVSVHVNTMIISKPVALFKGDTLSCTSHAIAFTNLSTGPALNYVWNFGDGTSSTQLNPVHTFTNEGIYNVSLAITDSIWLQRYYFQNQLCKDCQSKSKFQSK